MSTNLILNEKTVVFSNALISTKSRLKPFRDNNGLWGGFDLEKVTTPSAWKKDPEMVLEFYNQRRKQVLT